ncbi:hypothetical protein GUITHDRAFT_139680 [Guillardia theta CCMP2712]|uniref:Uncharacterized protein n=1 Tax=Guillardia theta (strain CCMP2712) TaxID=905079 RepID=L1J8N5_GUITC|nr:hypothetical protein GUITHDRAFT_139680 [Guillardia theta CCMP2712]EKX44425.1 hypothetical protein GUITHDRAFT_139680 [Guillardia theta CCMP2712]|eukprot:XP_005831405.1 hypothetical protein GUITHDRAFT_139680 [Guillardia theta CCMP2712]
MSHTSITNPWDLDHYEPPVDEDEWYQEELKKEDVRSMKSGSSRHSSALGSSRDEEQEGSSAVVSFQPNKAKEEQKICPDCHLSLRRPKIRPSSESRTNTSHTEEEDDDEEDVCICTPCKLCNKHMCGLATKKMKDPRRADELRAQIHSRMSHWRKRQELWKAQVLTPGRDSFVEVRQLEIDTGRMEHSKTCSCAVCRSTVEAWADALEERCMRVQRRSIASKWRGMRNPTDTVCYADPEHFAYEETIP